MSDWEKEKVAQMIKIKKATKLFLQMTVYSLVFGAIFGLSLWLGINNNPNFGVNDFFMNFSSDLLGMLFALLIVEKAFKFDAEYKQERKRVKAMKKQPAPAESSFEIIDGTGVGADVGSQQGAPSTPLIQSTSTLRDKLTGIHYLYVVSENGSALTPLLDKEGKPVQEIR